MRRILPLITPILLLGVLAIGIGCGKGTKETAVAVVDGEEIPVSVVNNYFDKIGATFATAEEEIKAKREALDSLIDYKLMVKGAYEAGLDKDPEVEQLVNADKTNFMFDELYRKEILPKVQVADKEVDDFYDRLQVEYRLAHILLATQGEADSVEAELKKGTDFGSIARTISLDQTSAVKGGDLGFVSWGAQVDPEFRDAAFRLSAGQTSDPVKTQFGWHIIRVLETRPAQQLGSKEQLATTIRELIRSRKSNVVEGDFLRQMEDKAKVEINTEATQMLMERLEQFYPKALGGATRPDNYFPQVDLLKPFERQMVLASYQGGEVTVEDYLKKIGNVQEPFRPRFDNPDSLRKIIFQLELRNIMEYEAGQRNVEKEPEFQKRMTDFREGIMHDKFRRSVLGRTLNVDEKEITDYYGQHVLEFETPREFHLLEIEVDSSQVAARLVEQLKAGADFGSLAAKYTVREGFKDRKGDLGMVQPARLPKLYDAAGKMAKGQVSGVIENDGGKYSIIKLIDTKEPIIQPVEENAAQIKQKVLELKRVSATLDWLKERRAKAEIKVFDDVLEKSIDKSKYEKKN